MPLPVSDSIWLEPLPDEYLNTQLPGPEARYDTRESVTLAFVAVLQLLPARQRAILILRDVLGWQSEETADLLKISLAAANSALQRARATMDRHQSDWAFLLSTRIENSQTELLLTRYRQAWENADITMLVNLLREDANLSMPPAPAWFHGRSAIAVFYGVLLSGKEGTRWLRLLPASANGCPAFATYELGEDRVYRPVSMQILSIEQNQIARIDTFLVNNSRLFEAFGLPAFLMSQE